MTGFPAIGEYAPTLRNASYRRANASTAIKPEAINVKRVLAGEQDDTLVAIRAKLISVNALRKPDIDPECRQAGLFGNAPKGIDVTGWLD